MIPVTETRMEAKIPANGGVRASRPPVGRIRWDAVIERAAEIAATTTMTLRQCFYILAAEGVIPNVDTSYKRLSSLTAEARRAGSFPSFVDGVREIRQAGSWDDPGEALTELAAAYRRDRTEGQEWQVWIGGEKRTLAVQLDTWFSGLGCPIVVCAGYASQTLCDDVSEAVVGDGRPAVLVYAGDFDPSGEDIARDFIARTGCFDEVRRVAVNAEHLERFALPPMPGKTSDSRAAGFVARHGLLVQVEVEAVHPQTLRGLYQEAVEAFWDVSAYEAALGRERAERGALGAFVGTWVA